MDSPFIGLAIPKRTCNGLETCSGVMKLLFSGEQGEHTRRLAGPESSSKRPVLLHSQIEKMGVSEAPQQVLRSMFPAFGSHFVSIAWPLLARLLVFWSHGAAGSDNPRPHIPWWSCRYLVDSTCLLRHEGEGRRRARNHLCYQFVARCSPHGLDR